MSIIIKGIDLPKEASSLTIEWWDKEEMQVKCNDIPVEDVIQIPKDHGDIVDRDEMVIRRDIIDYGGRITGCYETINNDVNVLLESEEE